MSNGNIANEIMKMIDNLSIKMDHQFSVIMFRLDALSHKVNEIDNKVNEGNEKDIVKNVGNVSEALNSNIYEIVKKTILNFSSNEEETFKLIRDEIAKKVYLKALRLILNIFVIFIVMFINLIIFKENH
jgi:hypothetical protein